MVGADQRSARATEQHWDKRVCWPARHTRTMESMSPKTAAWWRQATADLEVARFNLSGNHFYAASWFCQQAAEKALKALYIERNNVEAPRIHDLESLGEEVNVSWAVDRDLALINPVFAAVRYPDPVGDVAPADAISRDEAIEHLEATKRVLEWVGSQLGVSQ